MADNDQIKNGTGSLISAATDELDDSSKSPKVSMLDGTGSPVPISPATTGGQADIVAAIEALPVPGDASAAGQAAIVAAIEAIPTGGDATEATLAAVLAKLSADPATQTTLAAVLAKLSADPATATGVAAIVTALAGTLNVAGAVTTDVDVSELATQTTLAAVLAKLSADPATATGVAAIVTALAGTLTVGLPTGAATAANQASIISALSTIAGYVDGLESALSTLNGKDFATQTTLAALLAKVIAAPSTEAKQDTIITALGTLHTDLATTIAGYVDGIEAQLTTLAGYVDGLEGLFATLNGKDFATQTTLAALLAKVIAAPATEAKQDTAITSLQLIDDVIVADDAAFTPGTTKVSMAGFTFDDVTPDTVNEGDAGAARMSANRNIYTQTRDAAGNERGANVDAGNRLQVRESLDEYETVAASQTAQVLGATGATGDIITGVLVTPTTLSPGVVTLLDNATSIPLFAGGAGSLLTLHPFFIPLPGIKSVSGAWKLTTGAGLSCVAFGDFT